MSTLFTLAGCLTYTFVIITSIVLISRIVRAYRAYDSRGAKAMLYYELFSLLTIGTLIGVLFQNYARSIA